MSSIGSQFHFVNPDDKAEDKLPNLIDAVKTKYPFLFNKKTGDLISVKNLNVRNWDQETVVEWIQTLDCHQDETFSKSFSSDASSGDFLLSLKEEQLKEYHFNSGGSRKKMMRALDLLKTLQKDYFSIRKDSRNVMAKTTDIIYSLNRSLKHFNEYHDIGKLSNLGEETLKNIMDEVSDLNTRHKEVKIRLDSFKNIEIKGNTDFIIRLELYEEEIPELIKELDEFQTAALRAKRTIDRKTARKVRKLFVKRLKKAGSSIPDLLQVAEDMIKKKISIFMRNLGSLKQSELTSAHFLKLATIIIQQKNFEIDLPFSDLEIIVQPLEEADTLTFAKLLLEKSPKFLADHIVTFINKKLKDTDILGLIYVLIKKEPAALAKSIQALDNLKLTNSQRLQFAENAAEKAPLQFSKQLHYFLHELEPAEVLQLAETFANKGSKLLAEMLAQEIDTFQFFGQFDPAKVKQFAEILFVKVPEHVAKNIESFSRLGDIEPKKILEFAEALLKQAPEVLRETIEDFRGLEKIEPDKMSELANSLKDV